MELLCSISSRSSSSRCPWEELKRCYVINRTPVQRYPKPSCGKILSHCKLQVSSFREHLGTALAVFKIGITACPAQRFQSYLQVNFHLMWIIYMGDELGLIRMLEDALVSDFGHCKGCRNAEGTGGEGNLTTKCPPFFVYVTGGRADQLKPVG